MFEVVRCVMFLVVTAQYGDGSTINAVLMAYSGVSIALWIVHTIASNFFSYNILNTKKVHRKIK